MITILSHFILSEWIWNVTWGLYFIPCNILLMIALLKFFLRITIVSAVFLALGANIFAFVSFTSFTLGIMLLIGHGGSPSSFVYVPTPLHAFVFLGFIYALLQSLFFDLISHYYAVRLSWFIAIAFISTNLTVLFAWLFAAGE